MKRCLATLLFLIMTSYILAAGAFGEEKIVKMSTTTSTQASGLLDILLPEL